jgi:hypothetical protein
MWGSCGGGLQDWADVFAGQCRCFYPSCMAHAIQSRVRHPGPAVMFSHLLCDVHAASDAGDPTVWGIGHLSTLRGHRAFGPCVDQAPQSSAFERSLRRRRTYCLGNRELYSPRMPASVPRPCQNGRETAVTSGHPRATQTASEQDVRRLTLCVKRPSKQWVTCGSSSALRCRVETYFDLG